MLHKTMKSEGKHQRMAALNRSLQMQTASCYQVRKAITSQAPRHWPAAAPLQAVILVVSLPDVTKGCDIIPRNQWNVVMLLLLGLKPLLAHLRAMRLEQPI